METSTIPPIRILLVEDHAVFRQALALAFSLESDLEVVAQAGSLEEARSLLEGVDVAVLDLDLPDGIGAGLIPELHRANRAAEALILTASVQRLDLARAVEAGAAGLVHKSTPLHEIVDAVRQVAAGESLVTRRELIELVHLAGRQREEEQAMAQTIGRLTPRERDVLLALAEGLSDRDIAQRLYVSKETVHTHMVNLLGKLGVESRMQALLFALRSGVVIL
jgi:DNA-binding NarL/FixJ family response regulator